jgi:hypothetical protein
MPSHTITHISGNGPGFPNLSCLGLLSDRILGADFTVASDRPGETTTTRADCLASVRVAR